MEFLNEAYPIIKGKSKSNCIPSCVENKFKEKINYARLIPNAFNDFFSTVASDLLKKKKYNGNRLFTDYLKTSNDSTFFITPTDEWEIKSLILSLNENKSNGPNSIPNEIFSKVAPILSKPLSNICNHSFSTGIYPEKLKIAKIIPIYKKDSKISVKNYRPISLLSNINKIFEKVMHKMLYRFLEIHNCIYELQFGFRAKHATSHAVMSITEKIKKSLNNNEIAIGVFVDHQKAFDTVNHGILLRKLEHYGIRGIANEWFKSYLNDRKQLTYVNGEQSSTQNSEHGVSPGSVLGPLLFLIYINGMHECVKFSETFHFADDTHLLHTIKNLPRNRNKGRKLNIDLKQITHWLFENKISLNAAKTEVIFFHKNVKNITVKLHGIKLEPVKTIKYLGLLFDEQLTWKQQINSVFAKLKRANNILAISRHYTSKSMVKNLYYSHSNSNLLYGCQIWGKCLQSEESKILALQKKPIRLITFSDFDAHTSPLFKENKIIKFSDLVKIQNLVHVHKILNNDVPKTFKETIMLKTSNNRHELRNNPSALCAIPKGSVIENPNKHRIDTTSFVNIWNETIKKLYTCPSFKKLKLDPSSVHKLPLYTFRKAIKKHFLNSY